MKKITAVLLALVIVIGLAGCGGKTEPAAPGTAAPATEKPLPPPTPAPPTPGTEEWVTPVLDLKQEQNEITYQVPSAWSSKQDAVGVYYYPFADTDFWHLYISCEFPEGLDTVNVEDAGIYRQLLDGFAGGLENAGFTVLEKTYGKIAGRGSVRLRYETDTTDGKAEGIISAFITQTAVYSFSVSQPAPLSAEFEEAYDAVLQTVALG